MIGRRGLSEEAIDGYTVCYSFKLLGPEGQEGLEDSQKKCTICMEDFAAGDALRCLPCLHSYHLACIDRWLKLSQTCPVCKHNVMATTSPCFDSPTQHRCPPQRSRLSQFSTPFPRPLHRPFQVPRVPVLRSAPLPGPLPGPLPSYIVTPNFRPLPFAPPFRPALSVQSTALSVPRPPSESGSSSSSSSSGDSTP